MDKKLSTTGAKNTLIQLKISLRVLKPLIWRRVVVPTRPFYTLGVLHSIIMSAMGWDGGHMHAFKIKGREFTRPSFADDMESDAENEEDVLVSSLADAKLKFRHSYDFGDGWEHDLLVEKVLLTDDALAVPQCTGGKRACPPEDCGGPYGYGDFLDAITNKKHSRHKELRAWVGGEFDPEAFDLGGTNETLGTFREAPHKARKK